MRLPSCEFTIPAKLRSVRSNFRYKSEKHRNVAIRRESDRLLGMVWSQVAKLGEAVVRAAMERKRGIVIQAWVYRNRPILDTDDNLPMSFNKLVVDGLPRHALLPSDRSSLVRVYVTQLPCKKDRDSIVVQLRVGEDAADWGDFEPFTKHLDRRRKRPYVKLSMS